MEALLFQLTHHRIIQSYLVAVQPERGYAEKWCAWGAYAPHAHHFSRLSFQFADIKPMIYGKGVAKGVLVRRGVFVGVRVMVGVGV